MLCVRTVAFSKRSVFAKITSEYNWYGNPLHLHSIQFAWTDYTTIKFVRS